ncbi:hypothetical protein CI109_106360 [Kwoniella shandongensis]|uniref:Uncharacterized protein n=1 Tax=Kwoniella shandongensis TaxID=1734106 RepID=A0A5M6BUU6_9TREE|nr:uncharacterized protein CI109_005935 [Kwoniella shandongensis]KAA5525772.1 hypothetical protein CI109_005935 [Kwoniella shandongensis]
MPPPIKLFAGNPNKASSSSNTNKSPKPPAALPSNFSQSQAKKAVDALLAHNVKESAKKEEEELLPREEQVWLVVNTKHGNTRKSLKPVKIQLPHPPLPPPPTTSICLLVKSPQREYKDLLANNSIKFMSRVVGVEKLKGKFKPFEARRQLMRDHEVFLCDERIVPLMPKLLGKMFFEAKKQPIPVNLQRKDLKAELGRAISSTYFHPTTGTSSSIRISTPSASTSSETLSNLLAAIPSVVAQIQGEWENVLSIGIKTSTSVMLPIWSSKLSGRFAPSSSNGEKGDVEMVEEPKQKKKKEEEEEVVAPATAATTPAKKTAAKKTLGAEKDTPKKKSSTIGSGSVAKRAKQTATGGSKLKSKSK